jgi:L-ascorbate metabolism protein UlaG (beta-lactamase superfamily)
VFLVSLGMTAAMQAATGAPDQPGHRDPLRLTYVANEGVLVSSGDLKVLVDALFDTPNAEYRSPAPDVLDRMMKGQAPFDGVDLVLVTHNHPDHFDARLAARYLAAVSGPTLIAPSDAVADLRKTAEWSTIESRVVSLDVKVGEQDTRTLGRVPVTAFRTLHSGDQASPMNFMYRFELGGWRVFHEGDSPGNTTEYERLGLGRVPLDLALVHFWFPLEPTCARFLQEVARPDHVALMHLPIRLEGDAPGKMDQVRKYYKDLILLLPGMPDTTFGTELPLPKGSR